MTEERLPWFPCYPAKLLGALAGMKPDEGYVYWIVCLRIYDTGHACRDSIEALSRRTGMNKRRVLEALDLSFKAGRLVRDGDGIMNPFAATVMADAEALRAERVRAGREGASRRWRKTEKNQRSEDGNPKQVPMANDSHLHLQESLFPRGNRAQPQEAAPDVRTELFRKGLAILVRISGRTEDACRRIIGGWLKSAQDDAVAVLRAIEDAERNRVAEPVPWIVAKLKSGPRGFAERESRNGPAALLAKMMQQGGTSNDDFEQPRSLPAASHR